MARRKSRRSGRTRQQSKLGACARKGKGLTRSGFKKHMKSCLSK